MDIKAILLERAKMVDEAIFSYLPIKEPRADLYEPMRDYASRGGKRLRPGLCLITCEALGGDPAKALRTAAAIEMFHDWILIHDDIEDGSDERRGKPTLHKIHGVPLAVNVGDALHVKMWETIFGNFKELGNETSMKVLNEFVKMLNETMEGQAMELSWVEHKNWDVKEDDYYTMAQKKTGWYTIASPCRLGAIVAGAGDAVIDAFVEFGMNIGMAFQIQDDLLNLIGDEAKYGKEIAGDIWEGKRTLMLIHVVNNCSPEEREKIISIMNKERETKTDEEISYILNLMKEKGSIDFGKERAQAFASKGREIFDTRLAAIPDNTAKQQLSAIIDFVVKREL